MKITPELAQEWLKTKNKRNRLVKGFIVEQISRDIKKGKWQSGNPNPISFFTDGTLADGQHRLIAIATSGIAVYARVVYDVPLEAGIYIDTNRSRSISDHYLVVDLFLKLKLRVVLICMILLQLKC